MLETIAERIAIKAASRLRIGWFDWSWGSWDMRLARARAMRIIERVKFGRRTKLRDHL